MRENNLPKNLKITLKVFLICVVTLCLSGGLLYFVIPNTTQESVNATVVVDENSLETTNQDLAIVVGESDSKKLANVSVSGSYSHSTNITTPDGEILYDYNVSTSDLTIEGAEIKGIKGGTNIKLEQKTAMTHNNGTSAGYSEFDLTFSGSSSGTVTITAGKGYALNSVTINSTTLTADISYSIDTLAGDYDPNNCVLKIEIKTTPIQYNLNLWHEVYSHGVDSLHAIQKTVKIYESTKFSDVPTYENGKDGLDKAFNAWVIKYDKNNMLIVNSGENSYIKYVNESDKFEIYFTLKKEDGNNIEYTDINNLEAKYYVVTGAQGYGDYLDSATNPAVRAKWTNEYLVDLEVSGGPHTDDKLKGVVTNLGNDKTKIRADKNYNLPTNEGVAFKKRDEITERDTTAYMKSADNENWFYAYNYGFQGWTFEFILNNSPLIYKNSNGLDEFTKFDGLDEFAQYLDNNYIETAVSSLKVKLNTYRPNSVAMRLINAYNNRYSNVRYYTTYKLGSNFVGGTYTEKSVLYYTPMTNGTNVIIPLHDYTSEQGAILFNFTDINYKSFTYDSGVYNLALKPTYLYNLVKIKLNNSDLSSICVSAESTDPNGKVGNSSILPTYFTYQDFVNTNDSSYLGAKNNGSLSLNGFSNNKVVDRTKLKSFEGIYNNMATKGDVTFRDNNNKQVLNTVYMANGEYYIYAMQGKVMNLPTYGKSGYDLIFWETNYTPNAMGAVNLNGHTKRDYIYLTEHYETSVHADEIKDYANTNSASTSTTWQLLHMLNKNGTYTYELYAHYYRTFYNISFDTLLVGESSESDIGIAYVQIIDNDQLVDTPRDNPLSTTQGYWVIYNLKELDGRQQWETYFYKASKRKIDKEGDYPLADLLSNANIISNDKAFESIKLYTGCDLTIYVLDQSKLAEIFSNLDYDDRYDTMIGYKYSSLTDFDVETKVAEYSTYAKTFTDGDIEAKNWANNSDHKLKIYFDKIQYTFNLKIDNNNAGNFVANFATNTGTVYNATLTSVVDTQLKMTYNAVAGFGFGEYKFTRTGETPSGTQAWYSSVDPEGDINQTLTLTITGEWLRNFFYNYESGKSRYSVADDTITTITINTTALEFDVYLQYYDGESKIGESSDAVSKFQYSKQGDFVRYGYQAINASMLGINNEIDGYGTYYLEVPGITGKKYTVLNSWFLYSKSGISNSTKYSVDAYDFPILSLSALATDYRISSDYLAGMVSGYTQNDIINNRTIYLVLDVREIKELTIHTFADTYNTSATYTRYDIAGQQGKIEATNTIKKLTYVGAQNTLVTILEKFMKGATYYRGLYNATGTNQEIDTKVGNNLSFAMTSDIGEISIVYNKKPIQVKFEFYLQNKSNGNQLTKVYLNSLLGVQLSDAIICENTDFYMGNVVNFEIAIKDTAYRLDVSRTPSGAPITQSGRLYNFTVLSADFGSGDIIVRVNVVQKPDCDIIVEYALDQSSVGYAGEVIGEEIIYIDNVLKENLDLTVAKDQSVVFDLSGLNKGYQFVGVSENTIAWTDAKLEANCIKDGDRTIQIKLIDKFEHQEEAIEFKIIVKKVALDIRFDYSNSVLDKPSEVYRLATTDDVHLGDTISLLAEEKDEEVLRNFFVKSTEDIVVESTFSIDSNMIKEDGNVSYVDIGLSLLRKYKLSITVNNKKDIQNIYAYIELCEFDNNSNLKTASMYTKTAPGVYESVTPSGSVAGLYAKLDIRSGVTLYRYSAYNEFGANIHLVGNSNRLSKYLFDVEVNETALVNNAEVLDKTLVVDADKNVNITVNPAQFNVNAEVFKYNELNQIGTDSGKTTDVLPYEYLSTYSLSTNKEGYSLYQIIITGNDMNYYQETTVFVEGADYYTNVNGEYILTSFDAESFNAFGNKIYIKKEYQILVELTYTAESGTSIYGEPNIEILDADGQPVDNGLTVNDLGCIIVARDNTLTLHCVVYNNINIRANYLKQVEIRPF